jgi:hypothetical protein
MIGRGPFQRQVVILPPRIGYITNFTPTGQRIVLAYGRYLESVKRGVKIKNWGFLCFEKN